MTIIYVWAGRMGFSLPLACIDICEMIFDVIAWSILFLTALYLFDFVQTVKEPADTGLQKSSCEQLSVKVNCHSVVNGLDDCCYQHWRSVLENMCQLLSPTEGGVGGISSSIRDVLSISYTNDANLGKVYSWIPYFKTLRKD